MKHAKDEEHFSGADIILNPIHVPFEQSSERYKDNTKDSQYKKDVKICDTCTYTLDGERALKSHQKMHVTGFQLSAPSV